MAGENIKRPVEQKIKSDTESHFAEARRNDRAKRLENQKMEVKANVPKSESKEINLGEAYSTSANTMGDIAGISSILIGLGFSVSLINDFSDLATWQSITLISQALDIVALLLLLFVIGFSSRAYFVPVLLFIIAFILEILPVIGVVPWWTVAVIIWYAVNRKS